MSIESIGSQLNTERVNKQPVDVMRIINRFPVPMFPALFSGLQQIQFNNWCTGGCPWCAFEVENGNKGFSIESWELFAQNNAKLLPQRICLYSVSDPLDIAGFFKGTKTEYYYDDVLRATIPYLLPEQRIYTSTSLPPGTEETALRTLIYLHDVWLQNIKQNGDDLMHVFRFSRTSKNADAIAALEAQAVDYQLSSGFIHEVFGATEDRDPGNIQKQGRLIRHPQRNFDSNDSNPIACYDGTLLTTKGLFATYTDLCTKDNPFGYTLRRLDPHADTLVIPRLSEKPMVLEMLARLYQEVPGDLLQPPIIEDVFATASGQLISSAVLPSLRRDAQAFMAASTEVNCIAALHLEVNAGLRNNLLILKDELRARLNQLVAQIEAGQVEDDTEARTIAERRYSAAIKTINSLCS